MLGEVLGVCFFDAVGGEEGGEVFAILSEDLEDRGGGVLVVRKRCAETRLDFRGEYGS